MGLLYSFARASKVRVIPKFKVGQFIDHATMYGGQISALALVADTFYGIPLAVEFPVTVDQVAVNVTAAGGAGTDLRLGLMQLDPAVAWKADLLSDIGTVLVDTTGVKTLAFAYTFVPGLIYLPVLLAEAAATLSSSSTHGRNIIGLSAASVANAQQSLTMAQAFGALPATVTFTTSAGVAPRIMFRVA